MKDINIYQNSKYSLDICFRCFHLNLHIDLLNNNIKNYLLFNIIKMYNYEF